MLAKREGHFGKFGEKFVPETLIACLSELEKEYKKAKDDVCVAFVSDLHVGSKMFAKEEFERFIDWLNLLHGTDEQKALARKVKYLVISGDLIDGVGIYPGQEKGEPTLARKTS